MTIFHQIIANLANMSNLPRNQQKAFFDKDTGFVRSMVFSADVGASSLGLDITIRNNSGGVVKFSLDGVEFDVVDGEVRNLSNIPYDVFKIVSAGGTSNKVDVTVYGITIEQAKRFANISSKTVLNDGIWGSIP
jgi:hypothetical protein